jgi:hypothetical protein
MIGPTLVVSRSVGEAMNERQREIDSRIRKARCKQMLALLWESRLAVIGGAALLGALTFGAVYAVAPTRFEGEQIGHMVSESDVITTRKGAQYRHDTIQLDNGTTITMDLPGAEHARIGAPMKIDIYEKDFGPLRHVSYQFAGYADAPDQPHG